MSAATQDALVTPRGSAEPDRVETAVLEVHHGGLHMDFMAAKPYWEDQQDGVKPPAFQLSEAETRSLLALMRLELGVLPEATAGLDGTRYVLSIHAGFHSAEFCWWCELPVRWAGLAPLVEKLEQLFARAPEPLQHIR